MLQSSQPIYPVAGIRTIETAAMPTAKPPLMERAGRASAEEAVRLMIDRPGALLIACGPGNNGGDGFVMARHFLQAGRQVVVAFSGDTAKLPGDAKKAWEAWRDAGGETLSDLPAAPPEGWALVVDALFGIGLQRPITGRYAEWIRALNALPGPRMSIDVPSGLCADTGRVLGVAFRATHTVTFIALKPGLLTLDGPDHCGELVVKRLDLDANAFLPAPGWEVRPALFADQFTPRRLNAHKGLFGDAVIIGGAPSMCGAPLLAGRAALRAGAGRVFVGLLDPRAPAVDLVQPELMIRSAEHALSEGQAIAIGPGLGRDTVAADLLRQALASDHALVLDADALNLIADDDTLAGAATRRHAPVVLTPHPAEAARLLKCSPDQVQQNRLDAVIELSRRFDAHAVLKGHGSLIAHPNGRWLINRSGNPGMSAAGMGDVLTGLLAGLLAQRWPIEAAIIGAVHLHGAAADLLLAKGIGPIGMSASELPDAVRILLNQWVAQHHRQ
ncbi:NAD(P)H-hydrate dehydratase [Denitromonas iodatirespirans]|uniref:Bifunctional NAD(P)H-hydrate repair enzyme n=1 Tax=Denitromonas iodatirespirans TaxID=2795389 RepID=A0A944D7M5_DENI1|nr:NAD(P)H-hydrate dehydratase [Denitromonas iodatirespirans]MBT0961454.1 NAD(P)H-hydrate dehydratase [Denitromonas iodatirespirans]